MVTRSAPPTNSAPRLAVRVWAGLGALFAVLAIAIVLCIGAMFTAWHTLKDISAISSAERHAVAIGTSAREQYMHQAHGVLLREPKHLGHEHHWGAMLATHVQSLRPMVGVAEVQKLDSIESESAAMSSVFEHDVLPAAIAGDEMRLKQAHAVAEKRLATMIAAADASIAHLSQRTRDASTEAVQRVRTSAAMAVFTLLASALIGLHLAQSFARQIVTPVGKLDEAAASIGRGQFETEIPRMGTLEFDRLAEALRQMASELRTRELRLVESERLAAVGALAAGVAHELNNPLGVIVGYVKRLRRKPFENGTSEELRIIDDEAQQCRRIVEDLVALAREPRLELQVGDLSNLVRETCTKLRAVPELDERELRVVAEHPALVRMDPIRIAQVVRNLVMNAAAASASQAPIDIEVSAGTETALVVVRDRGSGIAPEDLPHVFEPFYSRRSGGTGLGLAVSQRLVKSHGGTIEIESGTGGTEVFVRLPLEVAS